MGHVDHVMRYRADFNVGLRDVLLDAWRPMFWRVTLIRTRLGYTAQAWRDLPQERRERLVARDRRAGGCRPLCPLMGKTRS